MPTRTTVIHYIYRNILIYGSESSRNERAAFLIIMLALFVLTAWMDPV